MELHSVFLKIFSESQRTRSAKSFPMSVRTSGKSSTRNVSTYLKLLMNGSSARKSFWICGNIHLLWVIFNCYIKCKHDTFKMFNFHAEETKVSNDENMGAQVASH